ncbi:MAG: RDD family protein [Planctomycetes bacterium]|nr:RDD family protein [Planctomycetota bacterium]MCB9888100.1 RDD family protein [Planctomycetota bacterium]
MDEHNPYQAPETVKAPPRQRRTGELAPRGARLIASMIDFVLMTIAATPLFVIGYLNGWVTGDDSAREGLIMTAAFLFGYVVLNGWTLHSRAQTLGKLMLDIRIQRIDGSHPGLTRLLVHRTLLPNLISLLPFIGIVVSIVGVLMIFRRDRRCMHDFLAGTRVVHA